MEDPVIEITLEVDATNFDHAGSAMSFLYEALRQSTEWREDFGLPTATGHQLRESIENRE